MKFFRAIATGLFFFVISFYIVLRCLVRPFDPENGVRFCRIIGPTGCRILGIKLTRIHWERLAAAQPCIYLANHQSLIDLFVFSGNFPSHTVVVGKKSLRWVPVFGWMYWLTGQPLIDRKNKESAVATMQEVRDRIMREKLSVLVFPEGTRSRGKGLAHFKKGAFHLAQETGLPLQPFIASSFHKCVNLNRWNAGKVIVEALPLITTQGKSVEALQIEAEDSMRNAIDALDRKLARDS